MYVESGVIKIVYPEQDVIVSLKNLHRDIIADPSVSEECIEEFVQRIMSIQQCNMGTVYPRLLSFEHNKTLSYPWVQAFFGVHLEVALIEHSNGRIQFLTPLQLVNRDGGLKGAKRQAVQNIRKLMSQVDTEQLLPTIWRVCHPEVLTSSLVLCLDEFEELTNVDGSIQFSIPCRGTLYFSMGDLQPVRCLIEDDFKREPYPISPDIFQTTSTMIRQFRHSWEGQ